MEEKERQIKPHQPAHLLDTIKTIWMSIGDALNDNELTHFLIKRGLPAEMGFTFLSFSDGYVTLTVPKQNPDGWYANKDWITPEKENIARAIAEKYEWMLAEPMDGPWSLHPPSETGVVHHHLVLADHRQTIVVAHPLFLKICLLGKPPHQIYGRHSSFPLPLGPDLLREISALYLDKMDPIAIQDVSSNRFTVAEN